MAVYDNTFHLVEFEDGIQVIPDNWIQTGKDECWYPNYKTDKDINKAIKKQHTPKDDWLSYSIQRFLGTYGTYSEAYNKLKKAEMHSDINTDNDDKAYRKVRARKAIDTDDNESDYNDHETCLLPYPKQPLVHGNTSHSISKEISKRNVSDNQSSSKASSSNKTMSVQRRQYDVDVCDEEIMNNTSKNHIPAGSSTNIREDGMDMRNEYILIKI